MKLTVITEVDYKRGLSRDDHVELAAAAYIFILFLHCKFDFITIILFIITTAG